MRLWGITDRGSVRRDNQDTYDICALDGERGFGVVCDGMGGARAGHVASGVAAELFAGGIRARLGGERRDDWAGALRELAARANEVLYHRSTTEAACMGMGTTVVAAVIDGEEVFVLNVGDSRCYLVDDRSIAQVTRDHSLVSDLVARGEITPEEARNHPRKNLITRALGVEEEVRPDVFPLRRRAGSYLLLCSDGLSNTVSDPELQYEIVHGGAPEDCCRRLLDIALSRGAPDNVTAVLVQL